jgi:hypothetical protein
MRKATVSTKVTATILAFAGLAAAAGVAMADNGRQIGTPTNGGTSPSNQTPIYRSYGECNDCWASGITLRESGSPTSGLTGGSIAVPPNVANTRVRAFIFWVTIGDQPIIGPVSVNGNLVTPVASGPVTPSPCWAPANAYSFYADVTPFIIPGVNLLNGFADSGNRQVTPSVEGVSLVIVHRTQTVDKEIIITAGNDMVGTGFIQTSVDLSLPVLSAPGFGAELTIIMADGQSNGSDGAPDAPDNASWNGTIISAPNAFIGLDPGPGVGFWDTEEFGVATGGSNTVNVSSTADCLNWAATVLCVKRGGCVVPVEPSTWSKIKNQLR